MEVQAFRALLYKVKNEKELEEDCIYIFKPKVTDKDALEGIHRHP
jgi:hypothetical protein